MIDWTSWENDEVILISVNTNISGIFNYTIEFSSNTGQLQSNTVVVSILNPTQTTLLAILEYFLFTPLRLALLISVIVGSVILMVIISQRASKRAVSKYLSQSKPKEQKKSQSSSETVKTKKKK